MKCYAHQSLKNIFSRMMNESISQIKQMRRNLMWQSQKIPKTEAWINNHWNITLMTMNYSSEKLLDRKQDLCTIHSSTTMLSIHDSALFIEQRNLWAATHIVTLVTIRHGLNRGVTRLKVFSFALAWPSKWKISCSSI